MRKLQPLRNGLALLFLLAMNACIPEIEVLDESDNWNPDFGLPLLNATLNMEDLLEEVETDGVLQVDINGLLILTYQERISVTSPPDIPDIPDFPLPILDYNQTLPNPTSGYFRLDIIRAKQGILSYALNNPYLEAVQVAIRLADMRNQGDVLEWAFTIPAATSPADPTYQEGQLDISGYEIDFRNGFRTAYTATLATSGTNVALHPFALEISDLDFSYVQGYLGQFEIEIPGDSLEFDFLESWEQGELSFVDPKLRLDFHSTYGVPVEVTTNQLGFHTFINGYQSLDNASLNNGLQINYPNINQTGSAVTTSIELNSINSNIATVISGVPYQLDYDLEAIANPNRDTTLENHLQDSVRLDVDVEVEIPLYGSARGFTFDADYELDLDDLEDVERAGVKIVAVNGFPIDVALQINFVDDDGNIIDALFEPSTTPLMRSAAVDQDGEVTAPTLTETFAELSTQRFEAIKASAARIQLVTSIDTPNDGSTPVRLFDSYNLNIKLGLLIGL